MDRLFDTAGPSLLGLDPVEANFEGTPEEVRLDPSDASFVDVIHTDAAPLIPFLGEPPAVPVSSSGLECWCFNPESVVQAKPHLVVVTNILGFGTNQMMGHMDFFPNGGQNMPGCKKNALSQIVDLDGIWSGKAVGARPGGRCFFGYSVLAMTDIPPGVCGDQWGALCTTPQTISTF